ncbi:MAG: hypothetical protein HZB64_10050 [Rhodocyclales bacterium]|nr:hypothetical protein [Rhodocyclales bacterium]
MKLPLAFDATIARDEFLRLLPGATGGDGFRQVNDVFISRHWRIVLSPIEPLHIGSLLLDRYHVEIAFSDMSEQEIDRFMQRFSVHYQRGGG